MENAYLTQNVDFLCTFILTLFLLISTIELNLKMAHRNAFKSSCKMYKIWCPVLTRIGMTNFIKILTFQSCFMRKDIHIERKRWRRRQEHFYVSLPTHQVSLNKHIRDQTHSMTFILSHSEKFVLPSRAISCSNKEPGPDVSETVWLPHIHALSRRKTFKSHEVPV
jgi:hypothetical protein